MTLGSAFDPNAAAAQDSGIFGLPHDPDGAKVILIPVPWDATTSYRPGTARGPEAILAASRQVDLFDVETGKPYERGIAMLSIDASIVALNAKARASATPVIEAGGAHDDPALLAALAETNAMCATLDEWVYAEAKREIGKGKIVGVVGGDHASPFGAIRALAEARPGIGILHVDAHADLRRAYEGFSRSHASIMDNVAREIPGVAKIVQVGIRDFCEEEHEAMRASGGRIVTLFDVDLARARMAGKTLDALAKGVEGLPREVYVSFDIDGLDPSLCPNTGTPVPGGLSFHEACALLRAVVESGRRIVGFDLNEVAPGRDLEGRDEWDANVGGRILYKMIGWSLVGA